MDAREAGHVPLCVPRDPKLGEHVDGHQQRFAAMVGEAGVVRTVSTREEFDRELDQALQHASRSVDARSGEREAARARLAAELDSLLEARPRRLIRANRVTA
jgi:UDP-N-acetylglucosamine transferase subunit ALG13